MSKFAISPHPARSDPEPERQRAAVVTFRGCGAHARRESMALADSGFQVDVLCLAESADGPPVAPFHDHVDVTTYVVDRHRSSLVRYALSYLRWFAICFGVLTARHLRRRYKVIQVTSLPDHQVFAAVIPKLLGAKVVLFLKEPASLLFATLYDSRPLTMAMRSIEMRAVAFADLTFVVTEEHRQFYVDRGADPQRIEVVVNATPRAVLDPVVVDPARSEDFVVVSPGTIEDRWGVETMIRAVVEAKKHVPNLRFDIAGSGDDVDDVLDLIDRYDAREYIRFLGWLDLAKLRDHYASADVGISAQRSTPYAQLIHPGKIYEYVMFDIPVVSTRLTSVSAYFDEDCLLYFDADDHSGLAAALVTMASDAALRSRYVTQARQAFEPYRWERQAEVYRDAIAGLWDSSEPVASFGSRRRRLESVS